MNGNYSFVSMVISGQWFVMLCYGLYRSYYLVRLMVIHSWWFDAANIFPSSNNWSLAASLSCIIIYIYIYTNISYNLYLIAISTPPTICWLASWQRGRKLDRSWSSLDPTSATGCGDSGQQGGATSIGQWCFCWFSFTMFHPMITYES